MQGLRNRRGRTEEFHCGLCDRTPAAKRRLEFPGVVVWSTTSLSALHLRSAGPFAHDNDLSKPNVDGRPVRVEANDSKGSEFGRINYMETISAQRQSAGRERLPPRRDRRTLGFSHPQALGCGALDMAFEAIRSPVSKVWPVSKAAPPTHWRRSRLPRHRRNGFAVATWTALLRFRRSQNVTL